MVSAPSTGRQDRFGPDMCVDFNGILPMPGSLNIDCGSMSSWAEDWLKLKDDWLLSGEEMEKKLITRRLKEHFSEYVDWETDTVGRLKEVVAGEPGLFQPAVYRENSA